MNVFYSESETSTGRVIAPFAGGLFALLVAVAAIGWFDWLVLAAGLFAVVLLVWWALNLVGWLRDSQLERRERVAKTHPQVLQYNALADLERARADLLRLAVELDGKQIELIRDLGAIPSVTVRGGNTVLLGTWLELGAAKIPWSFCAEWVALYEQQDGRLPAVGHWSDSRARGYAQAVLDWLHDQRAIIPAAGNQAARWAPGMSGPARQDALNRSGVPWAAYWWEQYTDNAGDEV